MLERHFVRSTADDEAYQLGPKVALKTFNVGETVSLTVSEFISPVLFFACESTTNIILDRHINLLYDSMSWPFKFARLPQIGTTCVARYSSDHRWYRARVVNKDENTKTADMLFIDYGNIERNVKLENIRKLEGSLSTQFASFMNCSNLHCQGALFGFIGAIPRDDVNVNIDSMINELEIKRCFDFQIVSIPLLKANIKNDLNTNVPFYLIKNNIFNKDVSTNYGQYLFNEFKWRKCEVEESVKFILHSFKVRQSHFKNIHILLPNFLQEYNEVFNKRSYKESIHSLDDDDDNARECVTPEENVSENEGSVSSMNVHHYKPREGDILIISDDEEEIEESFEGNVIVNDNKIDESNMNNESKAQDKMESKSNDDAKSKNEEKIEEKEEHLEQDNNKMDKDSSLKKVNDKYENKVQVDDDEDSPCCSVISWKMTSILAKSLVDGLQWHLPLPEETTFKAIITTFNEKLEFHINICSKDITSTFENMEKELLKHFVLCNDSMLKHYVTSGSDFSKGSLCLASHKSTYIRCLITNSASASGADVTCRLIDFGDEMLVRQSDLIPISDQFCQVPPLAVKCVLSGLDNLDSLRDEFHAICEEVDYQVLISLCLSDKVAYFSRIDNKIVLDQPVPVEVFILKSNDEGEQVLISVNSMLLKIKASNELDESDVKDADDFDEEESGMKDIFINENLHQQADINCQSDKRPVCEYYRSKGRCFKGSKCQDRHVVDSDESDNDSEDWKTMDKMHYLDDDFERELTVGSVIGVRVSAIYTTGIFYAYLTHDINGFIDDVSTYYDQDDDDYNDNGLEFQSIQDMETHLKDFLKFQQVEVDKRFDLPVNTMVAVSEYDMVHRGSIRKMVSDNRYQVFLVDYGVPVEANIKNISLLPKKYFSKFKQQCFMCKLHGVSVSAEDSEKFANWFFDKVNRKVLHCKVVDTDHEGVNYVEMYNFIENVDLCLNDIAKKLFCVNIV